MVAATGGGSSGVTTCRAGAVGQPVRFGARAMADVVIMGSFRHAVSLCSQGSVGAGQQVRSAGRGVSCDLRGCRAAVSAPPIAHPVRRVVIYARVSKMSRADRTRGDAKSVAQQLDVLCGLAVREGVQVVAVFRDDGINASSFAHGAVREGWVQTMEVITSGQLCAPGLSWFAGGRIGRGRRPWGTSTTTSRDRDPHPRRWGARELYAERCGGTVAH
jgi:hypothetical protein